MYENLQEAKEMAKDKEQQEDREKAKAMSPEKMRNQETRHKKPIKRTL